MDPNDKRPTQAQSAQQVCHKWVLLAYYVASGAHPIDAAGHVIVGITMLSGAPSLPRRSRRRGVSRWFRPPGRAILRAIVLVLGSRRGVLLVFETSSISHSDTSPCQNAAKTAPRRSLHGHYYSHCTASLPIFKRKNTRRAWRTTYEPFIRRRWATWARILAGDPPSGDRCSGIGKIRGCRWGCRIPWSWIGRPWQSSTGLGS